MDNPLWDFSERTYARDGVATACLSLQDEFGLDVNLLLYAAWLACAGRRLTVAHLTDLEARVGDWRERVIKPLRALRRRLRAYAPAIDVHAALGSLELQAEQQQQQLMYTFSQQAETLPQAEWPLAENLALVARFTRPDTADWVPAITDLASLLPR